MLRGELITFNMSGSFEPTSNIGMIIREVTIECHLILSLDIQQTNTTIGNGTSTMVHHGCHLTGTFLLGYDTRHLVWGDGNSTCRWDLTQLTSVLGEKPRVLIDLVSSTDEIREYIHTSLMGVTKLCSKEQPASPNISKILH